ncbi:MAG TPA: hypothetical protein DCL21_03940 [Alphaproteobacteria bacterium]|nr:hypothetical protein [Alphaproteobacteria bacterium]
MTLEIKKVTEKDFDCIYQLLKQEDFPYLPVDKQTAFNELSKNDNYIYAGFSESKIVLFLCFCERSGKLYFDIACAKDYQKKWASKQILKFIFETAFQDLGYEEFYVESFTDQSRYVVEKFGFRRIDQCFYRLSANSDSVVRYLQTKEI